MAASPFCYLVVASLLASASATKSGSFLASRSAHRRAAEGRLRDSASRLAATLGDHLGYRPLLEVGVPQLPALAEDARDILRHTANRPDAWDNAKLLNDYAAWAPDYVLVVPFANSQMDATPETNQVEEGPIGHSVSESTYVQSDGDHTVSQSTKCKDGNCKTTNSHTPGSNLQAMGSLHVPSVAAMHNAMNQQMAPLHNAMKQMTDEMKHFSDSFGRDPLKQSLGSIFDQAHGASSGPGSLGSSGSWGSWLPSMPSMPSKDMNSVFKTASSQSANSQTMSSETKVENGKRVTRQKTCTNGHCKTVVTTEDA